MNQEREDSSSNGEQTPAEEKPPPRDPGKPLEEGDWRDPGKPETKDIRHKEDK